jgi:DNA-binding GntR family transcriptional regulator
MITTESVNFNETIYSRVRDALREEILSGRLEPGTRLKIGEVCQRFNISHMPVREALQQLQGEGMVTIEPNKGAIVRKMDAAFIRNIYQIRGAIEGLLIRLSVPHLQGDDMREINRLADAYEQQSAKTDHKMLFEINKSFHLRIYCRADNEEAMKLLNLHWALLGGLRSRYGYGAKRFEQVRAEHRDLVEAVLDKDVERALLVQDRHCQGALDDMVQQIDLHGLL